MAENHRFNLFQEVNCIYETESGKFIEQGIAVGIVYKHPDMHIGEWHYLIKHDFLNSSPNIKTPYFEWAFEFEIIE